MSDQEKEALRQRLAELQGEQPDGSVQPRSKQSPVKFALLLGGAAAVAGAVYVYSQPDQAGDLDTRQASEFQTEGSGFGDLFRPAREEPVEEAETVEAVEPVPVPESDNSEVVDLIRSLQDQIDGLKNQPPEAEQPVVDDEALAALRDELDVLREEAAARESELQDVIDGRDLEIAGLRNEMDLLRLQSGQSVLPGSDEDLLSQRRQNADAAAQLEQDRLTSSMVAIGGVADQAAGAAESALGGDGAAAQEAAKLSDDAEFVRNAGRPVQVQRAEIIVNPSNTVTQGTMIQAVLETAIESTLEGPIRGLVTSDIASYDGSRVLIPRGSKLIGSYSADVETGQNRLLIAWERIIMPDNQSVQISSFGGDALGRSGTTGKVNNHFLKRFGSAALISTISAIPAFLENKGNDNGGGVTISTGGGAEEAISGVSDSLGSATDSAIGKYIDMPPTISVPQGTRITVMVDRDLEIF